MRKRHVEDPAPDHGAPANDHEGAIFTIPELAKRWHTSRHTIHAAIRAGRLQAFKLGARVYRIREAEVERFEQVMAVAS